MADKLPNFLIVGAAKSGTTSLYYYLKQHPEVYMCPVKEPRFITAQFLKFSLERKWESEIEKKRVNNFQEYKRLFESAVHNNAIGEASPDNLYYYNDAIKYIKKYLGNIKVIIILRNPVERAFSHYTMCIRDSIEFLSFEDALEAEDGRQKEGFEFSLLYKSVGLYYKQVKAYLDNFTHVKVYLYDDLSNNALDLIKDAYKFLGVSDSFVPDINTKYNVSGLPRNKFIYNFLNSKNLFKSAIKPVVSTLLSEKKRKNILEHLKAKCLKIEKLKMNSETREFLINYYREDILNLQGLINRDLSLWLK